MVQRPSCTLAAVVSLTLCACGSRTGLGTPDARDARTSGPETCDPAATNWVATDAVVVTPPTRAEGSESILRIAWNGSRFGVLYDVFANGSGGRLRFRTVDPNGDLGPPLDLVTPSPEAAVLAWMGTDFLALWTREGRLFARQVSADGASAGVTANRGAFAGGAPLFGSILTGASRPALLFRSRTSMVPSYWPMTVDGASNGAVLSLAGAARQVWYLGGGARGARLHVPIADVVAEGGDVLSLVEVDESAGRVAATREILRERYVRPANALVSADGEVAVGAWMPFDQAMVLYTRDGVVVRRQPTDGYVTQMELMRNPDGRIAMLGGQGTYRPTNPLPVSVRFGVFAPDAPMVRLPVTVNPRAAGAGACLEALAVAPGPCGYGVVWREGCNTGGEFPRVVYFAQVQPRS
jgi:hypothetical protein